MAGFVGWVRPGGPGGDWRAALRCLQHHASFQTRRLAGDREAGLGAIWRPSEPPEVFEDPGRGLMLAVLGVVLERRSGWQRLTAKDLAGEYARVGVTGLEGRDGAYVLVVWDRPAGRIHLLNDRVGSLPVKYGTGESGTAFAPEAKALFRLLPLAPRIDRLGLIGFLNMGHPVGLTTLFEGVRVLPPGHRLTVDVRTGRSEMARTWAQRFKPEAGLRVETAAELMYETVLDAHRAPLGPESERCHLALTGGYDSRMVLGALQAVGRLPAGALTWGATGLIPGSDLQIARQLAESVALSHRALRYESESVAGQARTWCVVSELDSDNLGYFAAGPGFLYGEGGPTLDAVYLGDHVLGLSGIPRTVSEAVEVVTRVPANGVIPGLAPLLTAEAREAAGAAWLGEVGRVVGTCTSDRPKDVQDHLFLQSYTFRWLFSAGFYKEPMVGARRPLLLGNVLDFGSRLPENLRVDKRVQVALLRRFMPEMMKPAKAAANCLVDWSHDTRFVPSLRELLGTWTRPEVLAAAPWSGWLDPEASRGFLGAFFQETPGKVNRRPGQLGKAAALRRVLAGVPFLRPGLARLQPWWRRWLGTRAGAQVTAERLVSRLALVSLLQDCIAQGAFGGQGGGGGSRP